MENVNFMFCYESGNKSFGFSNNFIRVLTSQSLLVTEEGLFERDVGLPGLSGSHVLQEGKLEDVQGRMSQQEKFMKWRCRKESLKK